MRLLSMKILIFPFKKRENIYFKFKYLSQPHSSKFGDRVKSHFHLCKKSHLLFPRVLKQVENLSCFKCILHTTKETLNIFNSIQNLVSNVIDNICCCWHFFFRKVKNFDCQNFSNMMIVLMKMFHLLFEMLQNNSQAFFFLNVGPPFESIFLTTFYGLYFTHHQYHT